MAAADSGHFGLVHAAKAGLARKESSNAARTPPHRYLMDHLRTFGSYGQRGSSKRLSEQLTRETLRRSAHTCCQSHSRVPDTGKTGPAEQARGLPTNRSPTLNTGRGHAAQEARPGRLLLGLLLVGVGLVLCRVIRRPPPGRMVRRSLSGGVMSRPTQLGRMMGGLLGMRRRRQ